MSIRKENMISVFKHYTYNMPNNAVPNGPVCGNGDIGVSMDASREWARLWIGKNDFWCYLPAVLGGGMKSAGVVTMRIGNMQRASFKTWQDASDGRIGAEFTKGAQALRLTAFAPRGGNVVLMELACSGGEVEYEMKLDTLSEDPYADIERSRADGRMRLSKAYTKNHVEYPCAVALELGAYRGSLSGKIKAGERACFVLAVVTDADDENYAEKAAALAGRMDEETAAELSKANGAWWGRFWSASEVSLPDYEDIERSWYMSHYIMACCCDREKYAPGIFGNFLTSDTPNWGGDYHLNYNHQAPFWGLYSSNHIEEADAFHRPVLEYVDRARRNAMEQLGCRGLFSKVGVGPRGYEASAMFNREDGSPNERTPYWDQKSNAIFAGINFIMRYYHTLDEEYLKNIAYPYLKEVGLFWLDYLVYENGRYVDYRDCIHENTGAAYGVYNKDGDWTDYSDDMNPVVTLGLLRTTLRALADMSRRLGVDGELREQWQERLDKLSDFSTHVVDGREVFRYTEKGMAWWGDNSLGIQHIYPAGVITLDSDGRMLRLAKDTLEVMARWEDYNAFPTFYTAAVRIGYNPDVILEQMNRQIALHGYANGFIYYGGGGIECCSTVPGAVNDMLVQNYAGKLRVFPVWNREHDASFRNLRVYGALLVSAELKDGEVRSFRIVSEKDTHVCVVSPWKEGAKVVRNGATAAEGAEPEFDAAAGDEYVVIRS